MKVSEFKRIWKAVEDAGYKKDIKESEKRKRIKTADEFGLAASYVIINSGMNWNVAQGICEKVKHALVKRGKVTNEFGHAGKVDAINKIWKERKALLPKLRHAEKKGAEHVVVFCKGLPYIGDKTKYHLAKNLGYDFAKPDVHLTRIAEKYGYTPQGLCERLAKKTGLRIATVDVILWRAAQTGILG